MGKVILLCVVHQIMLRNARLHPQVP